MQMFNCTEGEGGGEFGTPNPCVAQGQGYIIVIILQWMSEGNMYFLICMHSIELYL